MTEWSTVHSRTPRAGSLEPAAALVVALLLASLRPALAQEAPLPPAPAANERGTAARFLSGAAVAFAIHEAGHIVAGLALDARPRAQRIDYGMIPFFAIHHRPVPPRQEFVISSAGFWAQHAGSEWLLSAHPNLRRERSPLLKGMLAFNLATSAVYAVAAIGKLGPPERDTRGIAISLGQDGASEPAVGLLILGPALLDGYRYLRPEQQWAKWTSRGLKIAGVALVIAAAR